MTSLWWELISFDISVRHVTRVYFKRVERICFIKCSLDPRGRTKHVLSSLIPGNYKGSERSLTEVNPLFNFLTDKLGEPLFNILPALRTIDKSLDSLANFVLTGTDLFRGVAVTQGERVVLDGLEVDGDTERRTELVVSSISLANAGG